MVEKKVAEQKAKPVAKKVSAAKTGSAKIGKSTVVSKPKAAKTAATPAVKKPVVKKTPATVAAQKTPAKRTPAKKAEGAPLLAAAAEKIKFTPEERYRMVETAAYFIAERHGFQGDSTEHWAAAEREITARLGQ